MKHNERTGESLIPAAQPQTAEVQETQSWDHRT